MNNVCYARGNTQGYGVSEFLIPIPQKPIPDSQTSNLLPYSWSRSYCLNLPIPTSTLAKYKLLHDSKSRLELHSPE